MRHRQIVSHHSMTKKILKKQEHKEKQKENKK